MANRAKRISVKALVRALEGPPKKEVVYQFKKPKYERPNRNPYQ